MSNGINGSPLHDDLLEMLEATREAERDIYALLDGPARDAANRIGDWSAKDVRGHLAAWREVEADRLRTGWGEGADGAPAEEAPDTSEDDANARIHAERADWAWDRVAASAESSIDRLEDALRATAAETLSRSERLVTGIGAGGANHAVAHLSDVAALAGGDAPVRFLAFSRRIEAILLQGRIPDRDVGVMLYNLACNDALTGRTDEARRLLADAFRRRPDLLEWALQDADLTAMRAELPGLASG